MHGPPQRARTPPPCAGTTRLRNENNSLTTANQSLSVSDSDTLAAALVNSGGFWPRQIRLCSIDRCLSGSGAIVTERRLGHAAALTASLDQISMMG
jgi:hypothetical protein